MNSLVVIASAKNRLRDQDKIVAVAEKERFTQKKTIRVRLTEQT